jgi:protein O-GlcNAc transferase
MKIKASRIAKSIHSKTYLKAVRLHLAGEYEKAETLYLEVLQAEKPTSDLYLNLGSICERKGRLAEAKDYYLKGLEINPDQFMIYNNLGVAYYKEENLDEARNCYEKAISLKPDLAVAWNNLGMVFKFQGKFRESEEFIKKAIFLKSDYADAYNNLGTLYMNEKRDDAIACFQKAIALNPRLAGAYNNIGNILKGVERLDEAESYYLKAIEADANFSDAHSNIGTVYGIKGKVREAIASFSKALLLKPNYVAAKGNLLFHLNYIDDLTPSEVYSEYVSFSQLFCDPLKGTIRPHVNDRSPDRKLKIGYVSGDFRTHSVAFFLEPVLAHHDNEEVEVFCYSNSLVWDQMTRQLHSYVDNWRTITGLTDVEIANLIRQDQIDILVDLCGHTSGNRLLVFARKPAPVQVTWLGYPNTTGLPTIDYRITDQYADPVGATEKFHSEELIRMPDTFSCYRPSDQAPEAAPLPALRNGFITFGSFNNFAKITSRVIALWSEVLKRVPKSRLVLKTGGLNEKDLQERVYKEFSTYGISAERLELSGRDASVGLHYQRYHEIDIALDTFPYNGTTTTCDALWMGVPVITLEGNTHAGRVGVSQLTNLGVTELIAKTADDYLRIAVTLAGNLHDLSQLRAGLRGRMMKSPLMDESRFTHNLETAYRKMWHNFVFGAGQPVRASSDDIFKEVEKFLKTGKLDRAKSLLEESLKNHKDNYNILHALGILSFQERKNELAAEYLIKALSVNPDFFEAHNNLGVVFFEMKRLEEATICYRTALAIKPDYAEAHHNLGIVYREQYKVPDAMECFRKALEFKPDYAEAKKNLEKLTGKPVSEKSIIPVEAPEEFSAESYSQEGEDMILRRIYEYSPSGFYVDVGAHHPIRFSNTYYFYQKGWFGINIDAMPESMTLFNRIRPRDINVEAAIANQPRKMTYYMFGHPALNTFDPLLAKDRIENHGSHLIGEKKIETKKLSDVLGNSFPEGRKINFMSIDVEGFDLEVAQSNDWHLFRPEYLLVECYGSTIEEIQNSALYHFVIQQNYRFFGKAVFTLIFKDNAIK